MRSSQNIEQFTVEENPQLYDFYNDIFSAIIERYQTINKAIRVKELWRVIENKKFND